MFYCQRSNPITSIICKAHRFLLALYYGDACNGAEAMINRHCDSNAFLSVLVVFLCLVVLYKVNAVGIQ